MSINFKVFGLTQPGFEPAGSRLETATFGFPDLPEWDHVLEERVQGMTTLFYK